MHFLLVNVTFYDAVNLIHDVITTANLFQYTANFMFVVYQKYLTRMGEMRLEKYQFSRPR